MRRCEPVADDPGKSRRERKSGGFPCLCRARRRHRFRSLPLFRALPQPQRRRPLGIDRRKVTPTPQVRAILTDPGHPGRVTIGTQDGVWRSEDCGDTWRPALGSVSGPRGWSLSRHPHHSETIFAGYEPCAIVRSVDDGASWETLPVEATFPDITMRPEPMPKRVLGVAVDPTEPEAIYACLEIGGLLRSLYWGRTWTNVVDGLYVDEDFVRPAFSRRQPDPCRRGYRRVPHRRVPQRGSRRPLARPRRAVVAPARHILPQARVRACLAGDALPGGRQRFRRRSRRLFVSDDDAASWRMLDLGTPSRPPSSPWRSTPTYRITSSAPPRSARFPLNRSRETLADERLAGRRRPRFRTGRRVTAAGCHPSNRNARPMTNPFKEKLRRDEVVVVVNPDHPSPSLTEFVAALGFDGVFIDCEHGMAGFERVQEMCRAARVVGVQSVVRPESDAPYLITRYLDAGAGGQRWSAHRYARGCAERGRGGALCSSQGSCRQGRDRHVEVVAAIDRLDEILFDRRRRRVFHGTERFVAVDGPPWAIYHPEVKALDLSRPQRRYVRRGRSLGRWSYAKPWPNTPQRAADTSMSNMPKFPDGMAEPATSGRSEARKSAAFGFVRRPDMQIQD